MHFDALEPRQLLASTATFTDVDGDIYRVDVLGNGSAAVVTSGGGSSGFINTLTLTGTDAKSTLRVKLVTKTGDGRIPLNTLTGPVVGKVELGIVDLRENGEVSLDDAGSFIFGNTAIGSNVGVDSSDTSGIKTRSAKFGIITNAGIGFNGRQSSVTFKGVNDSSVQFSQGAKTIISTGDFTTGLNTFDLPSPLGFGSIKVTGIAQLFGNVSGNIGSITAGSFIEPNATNKLNVSGTIGTIKSTGANEGRFQALNFGSISGTNFSGILAAIFPNAKGETFKSIKFSGVLGGTITVADPAVPAAGVGGQITTLSAGSINALSLLAGSIGSATIKAGVFDTQINLQKDSGVAIKSFSAKGQVNEVLFNLQPGAGITTFKALGVLNSNIEAAYIQSISLGLGDQGGMRFSNITFTSADTKGFASKTAKFGQILENSSFRIDSSVKASNFGSLTARVIDTSSIRASTIGSITATGTPGTFGEVFITSGVVANSAPIGKASIGTLDFRGIARGSNVAAAGSINTVKIGAVSATGFTLQITAGSTNVQTTFPANLNSLLPTAKIGKITITQKFTAGSPSFSGGLFVAPSIGDITVNGLINTTGADDGGAAFGFGARTFGKITLKNATGQTIKPVITLGAGSSNPFAPASAGNFTIFAYA